MISLWLNPATNKENKIMVVSSFVETLQIKASQFVRELPIGISANSRNASKHFYPYHIQLLHELHLKDYE